MAVLAATSVLALMLPGSSAAGWCDLATFSAAASSVSASTTFTLPHWIQRWWGLG